jgi:hypothetical protein
MQPDHVPLWSRPSGQNTTGLSLCELEPHVTLESSGLQRFCLLS